MISWESRWAPGSFAPDLNVCVCCCASKLKHYKVSAIMSLSLAEKPSMSKMHLHNVDYNTADKWYHITCTLTITCRLECIWDMTEIILFHASYTDNPVNEGLLRLKGVFDFSVWIIQKDTGREKRILEEYQTKSVLEDGRKYGISIWLVDAVYFQMHTVWMYKGKCK